METLSLVLWSFWRAVLVHLWQSTLVIVPLFLLAIGLRRAPARLNDWLWSLALVKLFLPVVLVGVLTRNLVDNLISRFGETLSEAQVSSVTPVVTAVNTLFVPQSKLDLLDKLGLGWDSSGLIMVPTTGLILLTVVWQISLIWFVSTVASDIVRARQLQGRPLHQLPTALAQRMRRILDQTGIPHSRIQFTDDAVMPAVVGLWNPVIIVPRMLIQAMPDAELLTVLAHEDSHRCRRDPLRNLLLRGCKALFFFYPLVYPVLKRLRENAEYACDEEALATGLGARLYAQALARTVSLAIVPAPLSVTAGSGGESLLRRRLARLREPERNIMSRYRMILLAATLLVAVGSLLPLTSGAGTPPPRKPAEPAPVAEPAATTESAAPTAPATPAAATAPEPAPDPEPPGFVARPAAEQDDPAPPPPKREEAEEKEPEQSEKEHNAGETFITKPKLVHFEPPVYPESALKAKAQGTVKILVLVDEKGQVAEAEVAEGVEGYPELDEAALTATHKCLFEPGQTAEGEPTKAWVTIPFKFRLN
jgi:TonB family protein